MGRAAARGRLSGDLLRADAPTSRTEPRDASLTRGPMALALAALPAHVRLGRGQARQPRSLVAEPHRALLPLRDPAAADAHRQVYEPAPVSVPQSVDGVGL